jgi:hypothetical protein
MLFEIVDCFPAAFGREELAVTRAVQAIGNHIALRDVAPIAALLLGGDKKLQVVGCLLWHTHVKRNESVCLLWLLFLHRKSCFRKNIIVQALLYIDLNDFSWILGASPMKHTVQIHEIGDDANLNRVVFQQTLDNLDIAKLVQFINTAKPKRVYRAKAKTEAAK